MSVSIADLVLERIKHRLDEALPTIGASAVFASISIVVQHHLAGAAPNDVRVLVQRLLTVLDTPLPRGAATRGPDRSCCATTR
jgi:hypothetical protein